MKFVDEFRDAQAAEKIIKHIRDTSRRPLRIMEFCGGHTVSILKNGIRQLLPPHIEMLSGPGCPVCVTSSADLDKAIAFARLPGVIVTSFGDMIRVPGSYSTLQLEKARGADIRVVYSVHDALELAVQNPARSVVFIGIGFETTAPTVAAALVEATARRVTNFFVLSLHKTCPPIVDSLLRLGEIRLTGIICPGHVCAVIGSRPFDFVAANYRIGCVVSGFEPLDMLLAIDMLVNQHEDDKQSVQIAYRRGVKRGGNLRAIELMQQVFEPCVANWRGIGAVSNSGLRIGGRFRQFDAEDRFQVSVGLAREPAGCICGSIIRGVSTPLDCGLFGNTCTPENPVGPCMVSSEGTCSAFFHYGGSGDI